MVRRLAHLEQEVALAVDALRDGGAVGAQRVPAAAGLVARDELLVGRIQEQDAVADALGLELRQLGREVGEEVAVARVAHHGEPAVLVGLARHAGCLLYTSRCV